MNILLAEDEPSTRQLLTMYLERRGYQVHAVADGREALDAIEKKLPDLMLLDVCMPVLDGWSVLEAVRELSLTVPVLMLTALESPDDAVRGLRLGADDYLRKPFSLSELDARIDSVRRRSAVRETVHPLLRVGHLLIDDRSKDVAIGDEKIVLSPKEYRLLWALASELGRVFSNSEIIALVWGNDSNAGSSDVKQYVHLLRKKIGAYEDQGLKLVTVPGFGYKLVAG